MFKVSLRFKLGYSEYLKLEIQKLRENMTFGEIVIKEISFSDSSNNSFMKYYPKLQNRVD